MTSQERMARHNRRLADYGPSLDPPDDDEPDDGDDGDEEDREED